MEPGPAATIDAATRRRESHGDRFSVRLLYPGRGDPGYAYRLASLGQLVRHPDPAVHDWAVQQLWLRGHLVADSCRNRINRRDRTLHRACYCSDSAVRYSHRCEQYRHNRNRHSHGDPLASRCGNSNNAQFARRPDAAVRSRGQRFSYLVHHAV